MDQEFVLTIVSGFLDGSDIKKLSRTSRGIFKYLTKYEPCSVKLCALKLSSYPIITHPEELIILSLILPVVSIEFDDFFKQPIQNCVLPPGLTSLSIEVIAKRQRR